MIKEINFTISQLIFTENETKQNAVNVSITNITKVYTNIFKGRENIIKILAVYQGFCTEIHLL